MHDKHEEEIVHFITSNEYDLLGECKSLLISFNFNNERVKSGNEPNKFCCNKNLAI